MKLFVKTKRGHLLVLLAVVLLLATNVQVLPQRRSQILHNPTSGDPVSKMLLLRILQAEDERRWDDDLRTLFSARNAHVRSRAALAAGRIGNVAAVSDLIRLLTSDDESAVRAMAAFALGEIESVTAADALIAATNGTNESAIRARALAALGKIAAALPKEQEARAHELGGAIVSALTFEARRRSAPDRFTILMGLTAVLRAKAPNAGSLVAEFLSYSDPRIRADAANTLARLKLKDGNEQLRKLLTTDPDPVVRANAARVLGATEDRASFEPLLDRALKDQDSRVRVSAIRALGLLKDARATVPLIEYGKALLRTATRNSGTSLGHPPQANELLEIATTSGLLRPDSKDERTISWLHQVRSVTAPAPEVETALARIDPDGYLMEIAGPAQASIVLDWRQAASIAQALGEAAGTIKRSPIAEKILLSMLDYRNRRPTRHTLVAVHSEYAIPDVLRAYAAFKPNDLGEVLRKHLREPDVIVRATAAELLGELPADDSSSRALVAALPVALGDKQLNDAALAILASLAKLKTAKASDAIKSALNSNDYLVRRKAVTLLQENGTGDFAARIGTVLTRNTAADYERAINRMGKPINAVVHTSAGSFTISLLPDEATLTVDNFIQLAQRGYFNGITVHRVVPNFVIQDGDPRGDGNGGPGYQIRCEINEVPYARGAVGMALSGKDTGGSQWFVTHAPQPHLDGGYTVFGNVTSGMNTVDNITRGDIIRSLVITDPVRRRANPRR
jgi:cyclophilin family peptidyl-prolyl cis-trans isomerase/HEAT repeat protein